MSFLRAEQAELAYVMYRCEFLSRDIFIVCVVLVQLGYDPFLKLCVRMVCIFWDFVCG